MGLFSKQPKHPHQEEINPLKEAGFKQLPSSADLEAFGPKTLLIYNDSDAGLANILMKALEYKGRLIYSVPKKIDSEEIDTRTDFFYFEYVLDVLHSEYRINSLVSRLSRSDIVHMAAKHSEISDEAMDLLRRSGVKAVYLIFHKKTQICLLFSPEGAKEGRNLDQQKSTRRILLVLSLYFLFIQKADQFFYSQSSSFVP